MTSKGAKHIAEALGIHPALTMLNMSKTIAKIIIGAIHVGVEGAKSMAKALQTNKTLTQLDLSIWL